MSYFTLKEFIRSSIADAQGFDNTPDFVEVENLRQLVTKILDPLRKSYGHPLIVTSGYRCLQLNKAVGGAVNSQHMTGQAADIVPKSRDPQEIRKLFVMVQRLGLPFDQLINEHNYSWIHVSYGPRNRRQVLQLP